MRARSKLSSLGRFAADHRSDLLALSLLCLLAFAFLSPAVKDGFAFGGFDIDLSLSSLTRGAISPIHSPYNGDAVSQMIAWNTLDWQMIHHGQFPLWNQYSVLGMPQFLNFESSVLSLPDLVSYLFPLTAAFFVVVLTKLVIAGTGAYLFARVLRLRPTAAFFSGVTFMFSGAFASWLTWPLSDVAAWSGWILAFCVLCYRSTGKPAHVAGLGVVVAFSVYGGFPEANVMFAIVVAALIVVAGLVKLARRDSIELRGLGRTVGGLAFAGALSAPLWLPGLQVIGAGHRTQEGHYVGLPLRSLPTLFSQGYFGLPIGAFRDHFQLSRWNYYETVSYVGIVAIALVLVALFARWRRPVVAGLVIALLVSLAMTYQPTAFHPVQDLLDRSGQLSAIRFERTRVFTAFLVAIVAGFGLDQLLTKWKRPKTRQVFLISAGIAALLIAASVVTSFDDHLVGSAHSERLHALLWPVVLAGCLVLCSVVAMWYGTKLVGRCVVVLACIAQTVFLFFAGVGIPTYNRSIYPVTPAVSELKSIVGNSLVGLDGGNTSNVRLFSHIGFYPNVNIGYHIRLFGVHDPLVPKAYFTSWPFPAAAPQRFGVGLFTPDINSAALARRYGIAYVLVAPGLAAPSGMQQVAVIAGEALYHVSRSTQFSLLDAATGSVHSVTTNGNGSYQVSVTTKGAAQLICRVTDLPGWRIDVDGQRVIPHTFESVMLRVSLPPGRHRVEMRYWPARMSYGLILALSGAVVFGLYLLFVLRGRLGKKMRGSA